jgi:hypothetical protein
VATATTVDSLVILHAAVLNDKAEANRKVVLEAVEAMGIRGMIVELIAFLNVPRSISSSLHCTIFEDNNGALILATNQHLTSRTKYFHVKWHFFWSHVKSGEMLKIDTHHQRADYLTKGLNREVFEQICKLVQGW